MNIFHKFLSTKFGENPISSIYPFIWFSVDRNSLKDISKITAICRLELETSALICVENRPPKNSTSQNEHLRITKGTHGKNMYVCYKWERFFEILCQIIFAYVVNVSLGVRNSRNEAQFAPRYWDFDFPVAIEGN